MKKFLKIYDGKKTQIINYMQTCTCRKHTCTSKMHTCTSRTFPALSYNKTNNTATNNSQYSYKTVS